MARILVAEDEASVREFVTRALTHAGHEVVTVVDGMRALDALHGGRYDLLVTDIVMPGMNGPNLAQLILTENTSMKVLYVSGFTHSLAAASIASRVRLLPKPFPPHVLAATVRECLDR